MRPVSSLFQIWACLYFKSNFVNRFSTFSKSLCRVLFAIDATQIDILYFVVSSVTSCIAPSTCPTSTNSRKNLPVERMIYPCISTTLEATRPTWLTLRPKPKSFMLRILISISGGITNGFPIFAILVLAGPSKKKNCVVFQNSPGYIIALTLYNEYPSVFINPNNSFILSGV